MVSFTKRKTNKTSFQQVGVPQNTLVFKTIENKVLIHLVAKYKNVCALYYGAQLFQVLLANNAAGWVMWRVNDDYLCTRSNFRASPLATELNSWGIATILKRVSRR